MTLVNFSSDFSEVATSPLPDFCLDDDEPAITSTTNSPVFYQRMPDGSLVKSANDTVIQPPTLAFAGEPTEAPDYANDATYFYYVHDDHLGSSMLLTEGKESAKHAGITYKKGQILQRFEYSPFGQEIYALNPNLKFDPSYTGQMYDIETGLYYYKARYYNPMLGRFIQPDTIVQDAKDLQTYNRYSYVQNNPLNLVDPSGHFSWKKFFGALFGGLVAGLTFGLLAPFIGPILATLAAGILGGATAGGIMGGAKGALMGAAFGGLTAAAAVLVGPAVLMGIGLGLTIKNDGWAGLVYFAAGLAGAYAGNKIGSSWAQRIQMGRIARAAALEKGANEPVDTGLSNDPKGDALVSDKNVQQEVNRAFAESGDQAASLDNVHEQGGWITRKSDGTLAVKRWSQGDSGSILPSRRPFGAVGDFHTHPYGAGEGFVHGPSLADTLITQQSGIPSFIIDRSSIMRVDPRCDQCFWNVK